MPLRGETLLRHLTAFALIAAASLAATQGCGDPTVEAAAPGGTATTISPTSAVSCETPNESCPCTPGEEGTSVACGAPGKASLSTLECYYGLRTCRESRWSGCELLGAPTTMARSLGTQALGAESVCTTNPCDPYCKNFVDTPSGVDAGANFVVSTDGGLTLKSLSCGGSTTVDDDGDGWTEAQGDCNDCSALINPGAYDYAGNGFDDDCDGTVDNPPASCDSGLTLASSTASDYTKALDLCTYTTAAATGASKTWGVITGTPKLVRADASSSPGSKQYGIMSYFGNSANNGAKKGSNLAVFSSGRARYSGQTDYIKPKGWCGSDDEGTSSSTPCGLSWNKAGCAAGTAGYDSSGLTFQVRVPTNAQCMSFRFHYLSSEYPEWVCTAYNDAFIAMLKSSAMKTGSGCCGTAPSVNCNISYGASFTPVSVNNNLFSIPGCTTCSSTALSGTGFDTGCSGYIGGGSTGWLYSYAPVTPGEIATFHTSIWDTGDHVWDSTVLVDSWDWYPGTCSIGTSPSPPSTTPVVPSSSYLSGDTSRDFEATCRAGFTPYWRLFSWTSMEPSDSSIKFSVQTASTLANLAAAPSGTLTTASGHSAPAAGSSDVLSALKALSVDSQRFLRVTMSFKPSTGSLVAPTLFKWNQAYDCLPTE